MSYAENQGSRVLLNSVGALGGKAITGTDAVVPDAGYYFFCIIPATDLVIAAQGNVTGALNPIIISSTIPSHPTGVPIYGRYTSITLTSGSAIGYYAKVV